MNRLDSMVHDLLDASRLKAGESLPLAFEECDLEQIAKDAADEANLVYGDRFEVVSSGPCHGYWDEEGIHRLIDNLTTNAAKYSDPNSPIKIIIKHNKNMVTLAVHNEGKPIPADEQDILFQQFRRARSSESKTGWGLGLTLVKGMAEVHGGSVHVESQEGKGTTFTVELPLDCRSTKVG